GERIVVTDRGRPVAELRAYTAHEHDDMKTRIVTLADEGLLTAERDRPALKSVSPVRLRSNAVSASQLVSAMRDQR
ncbi:MAG: hypothetical protein V3T05_01590, partial [Myxococcota bacterium]